jgi:LytR cell envelope-related transcriptional attenuator
MGPVNTGTARIVIVVALIVGGAVVLLNGFTDTGGATAAPGGDDGGGAVSPTESPSPSTTKSPKPPPPETPSPAAPKDTVIAVFNGTNTPGLGATVQDDHLTPDGYRAPAPAADAPSKPVPKTIVYYVGGADAAQNQSDATAIRDRYFRGAKVEELDPAYAGMIDHGVQVVVVVGEDSKYQP